MALTRIENVNPDLMRSRWSDFNFFDLERFPCSPADCGFALDGFSSSRHCDDDSGG
jgi:hypothetical protein